MNRQEFLEMKDEFALIIYNYEKFLKDCILLDYRYNDQFFDLLQKVRYFEVENGLLATCLQNRSQNPEFDTTKVLSDFKEGYSKELENALEKHKVAHSVVSHLNDNTPDENKEFEKIYQDFIKENHPVVKALVTDEEKELYEKLKIFYYENNYKGFMEAYELNKDTFKEVEYPEDLFAKISQYYYDIRKNIGADFTKRQKGYPFIKKDVFQDDMTIAEEDANLKTSYNKLLGDNKKLHQDYIKMFGSDLSLNELVKQA